MKIGYIRVSTEEQNTARQEILLRDLGVDELFIDKASGKNANRPERAQGGRKASFQSFLPHFLRSNRAQTRARCSHARPWRRSRPACGRSLMV